MSTPRSRLAALERELGKAGGRDGPADEWAARLAEFEGADYAAVCDALCAAADDQLDPARGLCPPGSFDLARAARFGDGLEGPTRRAFEDLLYIAPAVRQLESNLCPPSGTSGDDRHPQGE
jgi:hypothetical protein